MIRVKGSDSMIEVKGTDERGRPQIMAFDGRVLEIFAWLDGKVRSRRFHRDHIEKIEIHERDGKPPVLELDLKFPASFGYYEFKSGGENLSELVDTVNQTMTSVF